MERPLPESPLYTQLRDLVTATYNRVEQAVIEMDIQQETRPSGEVTELSNFLSEAVRPVLKNTARVTMNQNNSSELIAIGEHTDTFIENIQKFLNNYKFDSEPFVDLRIIGGLSDELEFISGELAVVQGKLAQKLTEKQREI